MRFFLLFFFLISNFAKCEEIPIIVISSGKTEQSLSSVGSSLELISDQEIQENNSIFIGDLLDFNINGSNYSRQGGQGANTIIQLRGLPKRYTNVYLDGVKLSDPSTPDNSFYFNDLMTNSIQSIEVLKGNQSSIYGSGAIGGVINIFSREKNLNNNFGINLDSNDSKKLSINYGSFFEKHNFDLSLNKYLTKGISAMSDNLERDSYENDNMYLGYGYNYSENSNLKANFRIINSLYEYDEVLNTRADKNYTDNKSLISNIKLNYKKKNYKHDVILNNYYSKRKVFNYDNTEINDYIGTRSSFNYFGQYNFSLDNKIVFGAENDFSEADYSTWATGGNKLTKDSIHSFFFDLNLRNTEKIFSTFGLRNDYHSVAGSYPTGRSTIAYIFDNSTKYRAGIGSGIRFGSLNDYYYDQNLENKKNLKPEKSLSFDFGIDKEFKNIGLDSNLTLFFVTYDNSISNWRSNVDGENSYVIKNTEGRIFSKGIEIINNFKINQYYNLHLNYTFTKAYDGEDCDDPDKSVTSCNHSSYPVRVPKHSITAELFKKNKNINNKLQFKFLSERRDYGNANNSYADVILNSYLLFNLKNEFKLNDQKFYFNINNIFDKDYEDAYQYSSVKRNIEIGINKIF